MLILNEHHHYIKDGRRCPGVTEICALLAPRFPCDPWYLERGRIGHLITEYHDRGELDESTIDQSLMGYFQGYKKFEAEIKPEIILIEHPLYHPKYEYCGKPDRYGTMFRWKGVWDIKLGQPYEADEIQDPAYLFLLIANGFPAEKCWDIYLKATGTYKLQEIKNPTSKFLRFLGGIKQWREENNR